MKNLRLSLVVATALIAAVPALAQQSTPGSAAQVRPTPPQWQQPQSAPNPVEPVCLRPAEGTRTSPTVSLEARDGKVFLVVTSRPRETVAVVTHETGTISFDRPVCLAGIDAIVTKLAD
jgi:hypothetical protein